MVSNERKQRWKKREDIYFNTVIVLVRLLVEAAFGRVTVSNATYRTLCWVASREAPINIRSRKRETRDSPVLVHPEIGRKFQSIILVGR